MKKFFQDDDQDLIAFLRQNRPLPPSQNSCLENHLMDVISQTSQKNALESNFRLITVFSGTIAVGLAVIWNSSRWISQPPQIAIEQDTVETFLMNSWENTVSEQTLFFSNQLETDWFFSSTEEKTQVLSHSQ